MPSVESVDRENPMRLSICSLRLRLVPNDNGFSAAIFALSTKSGICNPHVCSAVSCSGRGIRGKFHQDRDLKFEFTVPLASIRRYSSLASGESNHTTKGFEAICSVMGICSNMHRDTEVTYIPSAPSFITCTIHYRVSHLNWQPRPFSPL